MKDPSLPHACLPPNPAEMALFGRNNLLQDIQQRLQDGHKVLLIGPEGIGKSALIHALVASGIDRCLGRALVTCHECTGVRAIVDAAGEQGSGLPSEGSEGQKEEVEARRRPGRPKGGLRDRRSALNRRVQQGRWLFILDHLSSWDPGIRHLLEYLFDYDVLALGAVRDTGTAVLGNVAKTLWRWDLVKVPPLDKSACQHLQEYLTRGWPLDAARLQQFHHQLLRVAEGNPGMIVEICRRAEARLDQTESRMDPKLLWLDWLGERCR